MFIIPDWDSSRQRFAAWWHGEIVDRVLLQVVTTKQNATGAPPWPVASSLEEQWLSVDYRLAVYESVLARVHLAGDAFPYLDTHIGPGTLSLYLGSIPGLAPDTVWYNPCIEDIRAAEVPVIDADNRYWQFSLELAKRGVEQFKGRALVSLPDLIEGLDTIASLVGTNELLLYLIEAPEHVHRFQEALVDRYFDAYDPLCSIVRDPLGGSSFSSFQTYGPGRMAKVQCDFSAMIGPAMFEEFVAPYLARQCARLDHSVFHLDGPCCIQHLDVLLGIKELDAIQWTPGAGHPPACDAVHVPLYRKILAAGKSCMIRGGNAAQAKKLVEELGPEGLDIAIGAATPEEADEIARDAFNWKRSA